MGEGRITIVKAGERHRDTMPTPGMTREEAFSSDRVWAGFVRTEPRTPSGWHHHGDHESYIYVIEGTMRFQFGPGGKEAVEAGPGDFVRVPPNTVHREDNPTAKEGRFVVLRFGSGPATVNVDAPPKGDRK